MGDPELLDEGIYILPNKVAEPRRKPSRPAKPKRGQANKRERVRTENVNAGFDSLRRLIPTDPKDRKLSKIEVLRLATSYINHLFNLTKANSCLEAENMTEDQQLESGHNVATRNQDNQPYAPPSCETNQSGAPAATLNSTKISHINSKEFKKSNRYHVCTFCLMMTKTAAPSAATKRK